MQRLTAENADNIEVQEVYAEGLRNLSRNQEMPEIRESLKKMKQLYKKYADNAVITEVYVDIMIYLDGCVEG